MRKSNILKIILILVPFVLFGGLFLFVSLFETTDISIDRYDAILELNEAGDMKVTETWDMNYEGDYRVRFRDINFNKYTDDYPHVKGPNNRAVFDEESVSIRVWKNDLEVTDNVEFGYSFLDDKDELGEPIICEPYSTTCESLFVDFGSKGAMSGHIVFQYQYTILGALTQYENITELSWKLFDYMESSIDEANITIHLPENSETMDKFYLFHHGRHDHDVQIISNHEMKLQVLNLNQDDFLEFRMLSPNSLFTGISSDNTVIDSSMSLSYLLGFEEGLRLAYIREAETEKNLNQGLLILMPVMALILILSYFVFDKEHPKFQVSKYLSDLPSDDTPAEIGYLFNMQKVSDEDITATLLDLIRKGYIEIDSFQEATENPGSGYTLKRVSELGESSLKAHEKHLLTWFFDGIGRGNIVTTEEIENFGKSSYENASAFSREASNFIQHVKTEGRKNNYFDSNHSKGRKIINLLGLIPIIYAILSIILGSSANADFAIPFLVSIAIGMIYYIYVFGIKRRSIYGHELYLKWEAFRRYLLDFEGLTSFPIPSVETWEHYLVFATTFKIAKKVMDQFKVRIEKLDSTSHVSYNRYFDYGIMTNRFHYVFYTSRKNASSTISAHRSSSSSGGSFGGGGGGGRSR